MEIRPLVLEDFDNESLISCLLKFDVFKGRTLQDLREVFLKRTQTETLIAIDDDRIIGTFSGVIHYSFSGIHKCTMEDMYVEPEYRRNGIANELCLEFVRRMPEKYGVKWLLGVVGEDLISLYGGAGAVLKEGVVVMEKIVNE